MTSSSPVIVSSLDHTTSFFSSFVIIRFSYKCTSWYMYLSRNSRASGLSIDDYFNQDTWPIRAALGPRNAANPTSRVSMSVQPCSRWQVIGCHVRWLHKSPEGYRLSYSSAALNGHNRRLRYGQPNVEWSFPLRTANVGPASRWSGQSTMRFLVHEISLQLSLISPVAFCC